jgi:hypothetical protein
MGNRIKERSDGRLPLQKALRLLKRKKPWAPLASLRRAVTEGRVPAVRSSTAKKARYYVTVADLEAALPVQVSGDAAV